ncbi:MAG: YtxH domain-containing protein [Coprobacillus sp.]|nr:YtxH domain-containing protein [Coprobacillus sp.]
MKLGRFLTTLGIGAIAGMLLAPKKGSELREELKGKETLDTAKEMTVEDYQKLISETIDGLKKTVDEFDVDEFKENSLTKLNELKDKFDEVVTKLQDSDQYSKLKDQVDKIIVDVNDKVNDIKEKVSEQEFDDFSDLEDEINDIEDDLNVIIDDLKD